MGELVKQWNDDSGDNLTVIYNHNGGEVKITSMPNHSGTRRETILKVIGDEVIGIMVIQSSIDGEWISHVKTTRGYQDGMHIPCIAYIDKVGSECVLVINRV